MMKTMVTTNVRLNPEDMALAKEMASEMGLSFNGYINWLIKDVSKRGVIVDSGKNQRRKKMDFMDIVNMKVKGDKPMGLNEDDEVIYG